MQFEERWQQPEIGAEFISEVIVQHTGCKACKQTRAITSKGNMTNQTVTIVGTRMTPQAIESYWGYLPHLYNKQTSENLRDVCIQRNYFKKSDAKKIKFYRFVEIDFEKLTNSKNFILDIVAKGKEWAPDVAVKYEDYKNAEAEVNANYPYGEMNAETKCKYVEDLSNELGEKFIKIELPT